MGPEGGKPTCERWRVELNCLLIMVDEGAFVLVDYSDALSFVCF